MQRVSPYTRERQRSSRAESAATYTIRDGQLTLSIPPTQPDWCADLHDEPLRVSCIQSASLAGQQPFKHRARRTRGAPGLPGLHPSLRTARDHHAGHDRCALQVRVLALSGIEEWPESAGEVCVAEIFGGAPSDGAAEVGMGVHQFRDRRGAASSPPNGSKSTYRTCTRAPWTGDPDRWHSRSTEGSQTSEPGAELPSAADDRRLRLPGQGGTGRRRCPVDGCDGCARASVATLTRDR